MKINLRLLVFLSIVILQGCVLLPSGNIIAKVSPGFSYDGVPYKYQIELVNKEKYWPAGANALDQMLSVFVPPRIVGSDVILTDKIDGKINISSIVVFNPFSNKHRYLDNGFIKISNSRLIVNLQLLSDDVTPEQEYRFNGAYALVNADN